jgi:hypothetical protein
MWQARIWNYTAHVVTGLRVGDSRSSFRLPKGERALTLLLCNHAGLRAHPASHWLSIMRFPGSTVPEVWSCSLPPSGDVNNEKISTATPSTRLREMHRDNLNSTFTYATNTVRIHWTRIREALIYVPIITTFEKMDEFDILPEIFNTNLIRM